MSVKEKLTAIADAIRDKTGVTDALNLDDMASGVNEVFESGKQKEWSDFWDAMQANGKRTDYYRAFDNGSGTASALGWNSVTFRPKYDLKPTNLAQGFMSLVIEDLDAHLKECGVILDTSNCTNFQQAFQGSYITVFPTLHLKKVTNIDGIFNNCSRLETVRKIIFESGTQVRLSLGLFPSACTALKNIDEVEGVIETNIYFAGSPLTVETMKRLIIHLKDYSGESEFSCTVTFQTAAFNALEAEGATAEYNGVACTWAELIDNKKWNLVKG